MKRVDSVASEVRMGRWPHLRTLNNLRVFYQKSMDQAFSPLFLPTYKESPLRVKVILELKKALSAFEFLGSLR